MSLKSFSDNLLQGALTAARERSCSPAVLDDLEKQSAPLTPEQRTNLELLRDKKAVCVVTGQQLGVYLGPLFTFYKVVSLLSYAAILSERLGLPIVPIFWLQSEDHDLKEASETSFLHKTGELETTALFSIDKLRANRTSVGALRLPDEIEHLHNALAKAADLPPDDPALSLFTENYRPGKTFVESFSETLKKLFGPYGLLLFDCRNASVRKASAPLFEQSLRRQAQLAALLKRRTDELTRAGYTHLVHLRDNSPLIFLHPDGPDGPRYRLEAMGPDAWKIEETAQSYTIAELISLINDFPGRVSTSALLRPVLQNFLLPTLAYIAGPAEAEYWQQVTPLSQALNVPQALVFPRLRALLLENKSQRLLEQLQILPEKLDSGIDALRQSLVGSSLPAGLSPDDVERTLVAFTDQKLKQLIAKLQETDSVLAAELNRSAEKIERAMQGFTDKYRELILRRSDTQLQRLSRLTAFTHPGGEPQERSCAFAPFWCRYSAQLLPACFELFRNQLRAGREEQLQIISLI